MRRHALGRSETSYQGWFGGGASPNGPADNSGDASASGQPGRNPGVEAVIHGYVATIPSAGRGQAEARLDSATRARLNALLTAWRSGGNMDRAEFASWLFGRAADDPVATGPRTAALTARLSGSPDTVRDAAEHFAGAMQAVGLGRVSRFLDDAETRPNEPSTLTALEQNHQTLAERDAIRPVYPVETAIGSAAAAITGGAATATRVAGAAVAWQFVPERPLVAIERRQTQSANKTSNDAGQPSSEGKSPATIPPIPLSGRAGTKTN
jgi:hypothetical protein